MVTLEFDNGPDHFERRVGYEVLDTSPAVMVVLNDGPALYPLEPLAFLATYASNGEEWLIQRKGGRNFVRVWATPTTLQSLVKESLEALEKINHSTGILAIRPKDMELGVPSVAIVTAKTSEASDVSHDIPDNTFFPVTLLTIDRMASSDQYKKDKTPGAPPEWRLMFKWNTEDGHDNWIFDATSTSVGESKATVAYLRQLINALHGRKPGAVVAWFDDETFEYGLDSEYVEGCKPDGKLEAGIRVQVMGVSTPRPQPDGTTRDKFKVKAYKQADPTTASGAPETTTVAPKTAADKELVAAAQALKSDDVDF